MLGTSIQSREFMLGNAVIQSRAFKVGHTAIQSYPKWGKASRSALLQISTLTGAQLRIKSYSGSNTILLNNIMNLHMSSLGTLVPEVPWWVFYTTRHQVYWCLTHNVAFCWYSDLISHTRTNTQKDTQHTEKPVDRHIHINMHLHHMWCAHNSYLNYTEWIIH